MSLFKFMSLHLKNAHNIKGQANLEGEKTVLSFARQMWKQQCENWQIK